MTRAGGRSSTARAPWTLPEAASPLSGGAPGRGSDTAPRRRRVHDSASTRRALLLAAEEAVAARGLEGARVEQIARRAGASEAMINYHFGGKEGLCRAAVGEVLADLADRLNERFASEAQPGTNVVRGLFEAFSAAAERHPSLPALLLRAVLPAGRPGAPLAPELVAVFSTAREAFARAVEDGSLRRCDPWLGVLTLMGAATFLLATDALRRRLGARAGLAAAAPEGGGLRDLEDFMVTALVREEAKG